MQGVRSEHIIQTSVDENIFNKSMRNSDLRQEMTFGDVDGLLCLYVGRISNEKRIDVLVEALRPLDGVYLGIVGDGPSAFNYSKLHGKQNRIYCKPKFLDHAELASFYASSDIHVSASEFETLGNTVLEAFSCHIPVVVPRTQGFRDTVLHGQNGYLFNPGDSANARYFIELLKNDPQLRCHMGEHGQQTVCKSSITQVTTDLIVWYSKGLRNFYNPRALVFTPLKIVILFIFVPFGLVSVACWLPIPEINCADFSTS